MAAVDFSEDGWDIFISFATPDSSYAEDLKDSLEKQGLNVFLAHESIHAGETWRPKIFGAINNSRMVTVLLSENSAKGHWQGEEVDVAIERQRAGKTIVVPVYIEGEPQETRDWEFGLRGYQNYDLRQLGLPKVAERLGERLSGEPVQQSPDPSAAMAEAARQTIGDLLHGAALRINRTQQWQPLLDICKSQENAFFLLHGPRRQNLDLFLSRISRYLGSECGVHHKFVIVPLQVEYTIPRSAAEWENHLRYGLAGESNRSGTAEEMLREEARNHPVFLVLSRIPIARRHAEGDGGLEERELGALQDFLGDRLPKLLAQASKNRHPIRVLLSTHYESEVDSLVEALDDRAYKGCEAHDIRYRKLPPVKPLEWGDIEDHLNHFSKRPPKRIYQELRAAFAQIRDDKRLQFRDILDLLARVLGEPPRGAS